MDNFTSALHHESCFFIKELAVKSVALSLPAFKSTFGVSHVTRGSRLYKSSTSGLSFSKKLAKNIGAGIKINFLNFSTSNKYNKNYCFTADGGFIYSPLEELIIGATVSNFTGTFHKSREEINPSTRFITGVSYQISKYLRVYCEAETSTSHSSNLRFATELNLIKNLYLRGGIITQPVASTAGMGFRYRNLFFDAAISWHQVLGATPSFSIIFSR